MRHGKIENWLIKCVNILYIILKTCSFNVWSKQKIENTALSITFLILKQIIRIFHATLPFLWQHQTIQCSYANVLMLSEESSYSNFLIIFGFEIRFLEIRSYYSIIYIIVNFIINIFRHYHLFRRSQLFSRVCITINSSNGSENFEFSATP